ncbi:MAG: hypothetical protein OEN55_05660 [Alphaproteobacteria bacterium]|nr:hypothetical protein [Alphaproteobacteria bacterium]
MPIIENDPWREQYFEGIACPGDVAIPTDDGDAYDLFPQHRWIYNKLLIAESQGIRCAPHGLAPPDFPVFSKPIYNMRGMGTGSRVIRSLEQWRRRQAPGHMWMELQTGPHVSTDAAVVDGTAVWWRHVTGEPLKGGTFDYWTVHAEARPEIEDYCGEWLTRNLRGYTGMINFETIGGRIIECHLRFSDQWPDLYGAGWVDALVGMYADGTWTFADADRRTGYSVVLFGAHGVPYAIDRKKVPELMAAQPEVSSIQITFHDDRPPETHAMPPGGFRLAIVNCWDLAVGFEVRDRLTLRFWSMGHTRIPRGKRPSAGSGR